MKRYLFLLLVLLVAPASKAQPKWHAHKEPRIIVFGPHPDDATYKFGGTAVLMEKMGAHVKFVAVTNGDKGSYTQGGGPLARRRRAECQEAAKRLGVEVYDVLDNHDGELLPTLKVRKEIISEIRSWHADVVIAPRPWDYHPDHRYTGDLIQDAAYMVMVPDVVPFVPPLRQNPIFLYMEDHFQKPYPFEPDIAIDIDQSFGQKIHGLDAHESQDYEWDPWVAGIQDQVPKSEPQREQWLKKNFESYRSISPKVRHSLEKWYGTSKGDGVQHYEAFEVCEYGHQPTDEEIREIFPMLKNQ